MSILNPLNFLGMKNSKANLVPIADVGGEEGIPLINLKDPDIIPLDQVERNRIILMKQFRQSATGFSTDYGYHTAYHAFPVYVKDSEDDDITLENMSKYSLIRSVSIPISESNDVLYLKICRKLDCGHPILLGLFEKRVSGGSEWFLKVCEAPPGSRFNIVHKDEGTEKIERVSVQIIFENQLAPELDCDVSYKRIYTPSHGIITGITLQDMLIKFFNNEDVVLNEEDSNEEDSNEVYTLW